MARSRPGVDGRAELGSPEHLLLKATPTLQGKRGFWPGRTVGMALFRNVSSRWRLVDAVAVCYLATLVFIICLNRLRRRLWQKGSNLSSSRASRRDPNWVSRKIAKLCSGEEPKELLGKQMSLEDRAMFEVSIIDALNSGSREDQHRLRSALIKYGYDEQCSRRVMSIDFSDRLRATALLNLLRPQWRETFGDTEYPGAVRKLKARVPGRPTGSLDEA